MQIKARAAAVKRELASRGLSEKAASPSGTPSRNKKREPQPKTATKVPSYHETTYQVSTRARLPMCTSF